MSRRAFLEELARRLSRLPKVEIDRLVTYYDEMIQDRTEDGMAEEAAVESIGSIEDAVESAMYEAPLSTLMKARVKESREKASNKGLWIFLVILGSPIWLPLIITFGAVLLTVYAVIWICVLTFYITELALAVSCVGGFAIGLVRLIVDSVPGGLCLIGIALIAGAGAIFMFKPLGILTKGLAKATMAVARKVKSLFIRKEVTV